MIFMLLENIFDFIYCKINKTRIERINTSNEEDRDIYLGNITIDEAEKIHDIIKYYNKIDNKNNIAFSKRKPIKIYINSFGGSLEGTFIILDAIKLSKTPIYTINIGTVQKESLYIFMAGFIRYSYPNATFLYEKLEQKENLTLIENIYNNQILYLKDLFLEKTRWTENDYNKHQKNSWWITAEEAQKIYICNEIIKDYI